MKKILIGMVFMAAAVFIPLNPVKAEMTYDLQGNRVDVSSWVKRRNVKTGEYRVTSGEAGTVAYFDKDGNLLKLENKETGEIIINNIPEETTTPVPETTTQAPDKISLPKVKKLRKKVKYSYYKGVKSIKKNGNPNWGKIKYPYGIKLTWKKVKNAKGYEIYRYENAAKRWTKIKTLKKNKKNPSYTLTDMLEGENVKIRVRAYKKTKKGKEYGKYSGVLKFKTKRFYTKIYKNARYKRFCSKFGGEDAFVYQNKYRKKAGKKPLIWDDLFYEIALQRTKDKEAEPHAKLQSTAEKILKKNGISEDVINNIYYSFGENLHYGVDSSIFSSPDGWYDTQFYEEGFTHYDNMISSSYERGAIAINTRNTASAVYH